MGRKSSSKGSNQTPAEPVQQNKGRSPVMGIVALAAAVLAVAGIAYWQSGRGDNAPAAAAQSASGPTPALKAHHQATLPVLEFPSYQMPRPAEEVRALYNFAAEHPEVLSYMPCYCGCERQGHRGNEDCFVAERDVNGDVVRWDEHGMECAVC